MGDVIFALNVNHDSTLSIQWLPGLPHEHMEHHAVHGLEGIISSCTKRIGFHTL